MSPMNKRIHSLNAMVMPEWSVWPSRRTASVREPVRESVGDFEHVSANKKRTKKVREPAKHPAGKCREFTRIIFWEKDRRFRRFARIKARIFFKDFVCIN